MFGTPRHTTVGLLLLTVLAGGCATNGSDAATHPADLPNPEPAGADVPPPEPTNDPTEPEPVISQTTPTSEDTVEFDCPTPVEFTDVTTPTDVTIADHPTSQPVTHTLPHGLYLTTPDTLTAFPEQFSPAGITLANLLGVTDDQHSIVVTVTCTTGPAPLPGFAGTMTRELVDPAAVGLPAWFAHEVNDVITEPNNRTIFGVSPADPTVITSRLSEPTQVADTLTAADYPATDTTAPIRFLLTDTGALITAAAYVTNLTDPTAAADPAMIRLATNIIGSLRFAPTCPDCPDATTPAVLPTHTTNTSTGGNDDVDTPAPLDSASQVIHAAGNTTIVAQPVRLAVYNHPDATVARWTLTDDRTALTDDGTALVTSDTPRANIALLNSNDQPVTPTSNNLIGGWFLTITGPTNGFNLGPADVPINVYGTPDGNLTEILTGNGPFSLDVIADDGTPLTITDIDLTLLFNTQR